MAATTVTKLILSSERIPKLPISPISPIPPPKSSPIRSFAAVFLFFSIIGCREICLGYRDWSSFAVCSSIRPEISKECCTCLAEHVVEESFCTNGNIILSDGTCPEDDADAGNGFPSPVDLFPDGLFPNLTDTDVDAGVVTTFTACMPNQTAETCTTALTDETLDADAGSIRVVGACVLKNQTQEGPCASACTGVLAWPDATTSP